MTEQYLLIFHLKTSTNAEIAEIECLVFHLEIELHIFQHVQRQILKEIDCVMTSWDC